MKTKQLKFSVRYTSQNGSVGIIHVFANDEAEAREIVKTYGVGFWNNRRQYVKDITEVREV